MSTIKRFEIYLAGAMTGLTFEQYNGWRKDIMTKLEDLTKFLSIEVKCVNPADYYSLEDVNSYETEVEAMNYDLYRVKKSDLVIVNFAHKTSSLGTMAEIAIAYILGIPVIGLNENNSIIHPWQKAMCFKMFDDMEDMLLFVLKHYLN